MLIILSICLAYLIGSLSSAVIICKLWGLPDPRSQGSFNPGATNVLRIGGNAPAILTLIGDACKGWIPTLFVAQMGFSSWGIGGVMLATLVGHILPLFFDFKGGKGVATAMGAYMGMNWQIGGLLIAIWALVIVVTRISSLAAIVTAVLAPLASWLLYDVDLTIATSIMSLILLFRHRDNMLRLWRGEEAKI